MDFICDMVTGDESETGNVFSAAAIFHAEEVDEDNEDTETFPVLVTSH